MKNMISKLFYKRNAPAALLLALGVLLFLGLACGQKTPPPSQYVGVWTSDEGTLVTIRSDGSGDYKSGGTSVTNGSVAVDEGAKTLKITFASMGPSFTIDKPPSGGQMTLSGVVFKKSGGGSDTKTDSSPDTKSDDSRSTVPSDEKLQNLTKATMNDFSDAVQAGDFTDFHKKIAKVWRDDTSPDDLLTSFKGFVDDKEHYNFKKAISSLNATYSPAPSMDKVRGLDALIVNGYYPTKPMRANFELKYTMDEGAWKLIGIRIKTSNE